MNVPGIINGEGEFAVGFGDAADNAVRIATLALADKSVEDVKQAVDDVKQLSLTPIDETIDYAKDTISNVNGILHGCIDAKCSEITGTINLINSTIDTHLNHSLEYIASMMVGIMSEFPINATEIQNIETKLINPADLVDLSDFQNYLSSSPVNAAPDPPKPRCPDGSYATCPTYSDMVLQDGKWVCISTIDGKPVEMLCGIIPPGGGGGGGVEKYKCIDNKCVPDPTGTLTLAECQAQCTPNNPPGGESKCTDDKGNVINVGNCSIGTTTYTCVSGDQTTTFKCVTVVGDCFKNVCQGEIVVLPPEPIPPTPPELPPVDTSTMCDHAYVEQSDDENIVSTVSTKMYYSIPPAINKPLPLTGKINCLKSGNAEFVCNGHVIWRGPSSMIGKPQGQNSVSWEVTQEINDDDSISWIYSDSTNDSEMRFDTPVNFYLLQFGHADDACDEFIIVEEPIPSVPVVQVSGDYCSPTFWQEAKDSWTKDTFTGNVTLDKLNKIIEEKYREAINVDNSFWNRITSWSTALLQGAATFIIFLPFKFAQTVSSILPTPSQCSAVLYGPIWFLKCVVNDIPLIEKFFPAPIKAYMQYMYNYNCQVVIPGQGDVNSLLNQNHLTPDEWEFATKMHGNCVSWQKRITEAMEKDYSVSECVDMYNAGKFTDKEFCEHMHEIGWVGDDMLEGVKYLGKVVPSVGELFEGMTRDINNPAIINALGLNDVLDERNVGDIGEWLDRHGMTNDVLKYRWRLHWKQIDQRVVIRLYTSGQLDYDGMVEVYKFNGHPPRIAEKLAKAVEIQYFDRKAQYEGRRSLKEITYDYMQGIIDREQYEGLMFNHGVPMDQLQQRIDSADDEWNQKEFNRLVSPLRKAYMSGRIDDGQYLGRLVVAGMTEETANLTVEHDKLNRDLQDKPIMISKLCKLVGQGFITIDDYQSRASNLGFNELDAMLMASSCAAEIAEQQLKKRETEQRAAVQKAKEEQAQRDKEQKMREKSWKDKRTLAQRNRRTKNATLPTSPNEILIPDGFGGMSPN